MRISSITGTLMWEIYNLFYCYFLLIPRIWASTVITRPLNLYFSASLIVALVYSQLLETYICNNRKPSPFYISISFNDLVDNVLSVNAILFSLATLAGIFYPSGWQRLLRAHGEKPKGRFNYLPKSFVLRSTLGVLMSTLGIIMRRWKAISFYVLVIYCSLPD